MFVLIKQNLFFIFRCVNSLIIEKDLEAINCLKIYAELQSKMFINALVLAFFVNFCDGGNRCVDQNAIYKRSVTVPDLSEEFFQGDIELSDEQKNLMSNHRTSRTGVRDIVVRWPKSENGLVIIPYSISRNSGYTKREINSIEGAMRAIQSVSCIRFVPQYAEKDYLEFFSGGGCFSKLGKIGGRQGVSIKRGECVRKSQISHEIFHALGFTHMHNRSDRDKYIQIYPENLKYANWMRHFDKIDSRYFDDYGTSYDLLSVMHYPRYLFELTKELKITEDKLILL